MQSSLFTNWTDETFTGYWDGKPKTFKPGESKYMPDFLARHFAKHLTNRELLREKKDGTLVYKNGDKFTTPKFPEQVPLYMELFNKAYTPEEAESEEVGSQDENLDELVDSMNKNHEFPNKPE